MACKTTLVRQQIRNLSGGGARFSVGSSDPCADNNDKLNKAELGVNVADESLQVGVNSGIKDVPLLEGNLANDGKVVKWNDSLKKFVFGADAGEVNTASNQGTGGVGFFDNKNGVDLEFRNAISLNDRLGIALNVGDKNVEFTINEGNIVHQNLSGAGTNTHGQIDSHIGDNTIHYTQPNITTVGTIGTGVWNGTMIAIANGGTGQTTAQAAINALTDVGSASEGQILTKVGANAVFENAATINTIYSNNDSLDSARTITMGSNTLTFTGNTTNFIGGGGDVVIAKNASDEIFKLTNTGRSIFTGRGSASNPMALFQESKGGTVNLRVSNTVAAGNATAHATLELAITGKTADKFERKSVTSTMNSANMLFVSAESGTTGLALESRQVTDPRIQIFLGGAVNDAAIHGEWRTQGLKVGSKGIADAKLHITGNIKIVDGTQGNGKVLTSNTDGLASWQTPATPGEINTASNQGTGGVGFFDNKDGVDLEFRNAISLNNRLGIVLNGGDKNVEFTINEGNIVHQNISGSGTNTHAQIDSHIGDSTIHYTQSNITTVGVVANGTWSADTIAINKGGTGATTKITAFNALSPITTKADIITRNGTNNIRLAVGSNGQVLTADSAEISGLKWANVAAGGNTIYSSDDSLAGSRTVTMGANTLTFDGNTTIVKGLNEANTDFSFKAQDSLGVDIFQVRNDNRIVYIDGNQADGRVLKSDANGVATWENLVAFVDPLNNVLFTGNFTGAKDILWSKTGTATSTATQVGSQKASFEMSLFDGTVEDIQTWNIEAIASTTSNQSSTLSLGISGVSIFQVRNDNRIIYVDGNQTLGHVLTSDANGVATWQAPTGGGTPAGADTQIQFNNSGAFGASSNLTWNDTTFAISNPGVSGATTTFEVSNSTNSSVHKIKGDGSIDIFARKLVFAVDSTIKWNVNGVFENGQANEPNTIGAASSSQGIFGTNITLTRARKGLTIGNTNIVGSVSEVRSGLISGENITATLGIAIAAIGNDIEITGNNAVALGDDILQRGTSGIAIGVGLVVDNHSNTIMIGRNLEIQQPDNVLFGTGGISTTILTSSYEQGIYFGAGSDDPHFGVVFPVRGSADGRSSSIGLGSNALLGMGTAGMGEGVFVIGNAGVNPTASVANSATLFVKDVSASAELFVRDEAGNETQISPHDDKNCWIYHSINRKVKKGIKIHMEEFMRKLEEVHGWGLFEEFEVEEEKIPKKDPKKRLKK